MKRTIASLSLAAVLAALLVGCNSVPVSSDSGPFDLSNSTKLSALCGDKAESVLATVASAADAKPNSGKRNSLKEWGVDNPKDDKALAAIQTTLEERAKVDCEAPTVNPASSPKLTDDERAALIKALTVKTVPASAECKTDDFGNVDYEIDSLLAVPPRMWPDAISTPFVATDPTAMRVELQKEICEDVVLGVSYLTFTATSVRDTLLAETGIDLNKLNPRLGEYTDISQITPKATAFVPQLNIVDLSKKQIEEAMAKNADWQKDAALVNTLLERFAVLGIEARQSIVNYHLVDYALDADALPTVGVNDKQENLPALIFAITEKGQCGEITAFGANTSDKRPELFEAKKCVPPVETPPTTTVPPPPGCTSNCNPTPPCTSNCGNAPKTSHIPRPGTDNTTDSGTGTKPPAPTPQAPAEVIPSPVDTTPSGPVDTGTTLPNESGTPGGTSPGDTSNGVVTD